MLPTEIVERRWLEAAGKLFWSGWNLGAADGQSTASNVNNYLAQGLLRFFVNSQKPSAVLELFGDLSRRAPEVNSLLAQALLAAGKNTLPPTYPHLSILVERPRARGGADHALCA